MDTTNTKIQPGTYTFCLRSDVKLKYARNADAIKSAASEQKRLDSVVKELTVAAKEKIAELLPGAELERLRATAKIGSGAPFAEIIEYAQVHRIDLIVIGIHGRGPLAQTLLGGVADKVIRKAPCPVLTIRLDEGSVEANVGP